jgi:hypothetical protein
VLTTKREYLDQEVLAHAYKESRILLTNDKGDFGKLIFAFNHLHSGVVLFRLPGAKLQTKIRKLNTVLAAH